MKNIIIKLFFIAILIYSSAQAQNVMAIDTSYNVPAIEDTLLKSYKAGMEKWLKAMISPSTPIRNNMINEILKNAEYDKMYYTSIKKRSLIVPLKASYFSQHISRSGAMPFQYLYFRIDKKGNLEGADIELVYPADKNLKQLPKNTFQNFYTQNGALDGTYTLVSIYVGDYKISEIDIKGGERVAHRAWRQKNVDGNLGNTREWVLETDIIGKDGIKTTTKSLGKSSTVNPPQFKGDKRMEGINQ